MAEITCDVGDAVWSSADDALVEHVVERADRLGVFPRSRVVLARVARTPYAYVVFDREHRRNLDRVEAYAREQGVHLLGRFGQFDYINTDQVILRALGLAQKLGAA
jgi:protoporphyrinogen oxidase